MTILRRNIQELMIQENRGVSMVLNIEDAVALAFSINDEIRQRHGPKQTIRITPVEVQRMFLFHAQRVTRVTAEMSARDIAISRTREELISRDAARRATVVRDASLSYIESIETTRTLNANVGKGVIRAKKKNIAGVAGGIRLF
jgi:hypothetical protein